MKWLVLFEVKDYVRDWSNQKIETKYKDVSAQIAIEDLSAKMVLIGDNYVEESFYLLWELLFLYDGYFYKPKYFEIDGNEREVSSLVRRPFYITDEQWYESELLGRGFRNLSSEILAKYAAFRNKGMKEQKMTKSVVNAFYYLHSEAYQAIHPNHRLSLLLNIADGFIINTFNKTNNVKGSLDKIFKDTIDVRKIRKGLLLLGLPTERIEQFRYNMAEERNMFAHYEYSKDSIAAFVYNSPERKSHFITWYFIYLLELVLRIKFLGESGVELEQCARDYAMDAIVDWIIYENEIDEQCATYGYQIQQIRRSMLENDLCNNEMD